jgi:hypothetical protein
MIYLFLIAPFIVFIVFPIWYLLDYWYVVKHHKTKNRTNKHEKGWSKCYYCGVATSPIYYFHKWYHIHRRYKCGHCDETKNTWPKQSKPEDKP